MPKRIWMIVPTWGCPRSHTFILNDSRGQRRKYRFERNMSCRVEDEHVDLILNTRLPDSQGRLQAVFTDTPPPVQVDDSERVRMQVEAQAEQIEELKRTIAALVDGDKGAALSRTAEGILGRLRGDG